MNDDTVTIPCMMVYLGLDRKRSVGLLQSDGAFVPPVGRQAPRFLPCLDTLRPLGILLSWRDGLQVVRIDVPGVTRFRAANCRSLT